MPFLRCREGAVKAGGCYRERQVQSSDLVMGTEEEQVGGEVWWLWGDLGDGHGWRHVRVVVVACGAPAEPGGAIHRARGCPPMRRRRIAPPCSSSSPNQGRVKWPASQMRGRGGGGGGRRGVGGGRGARRRGRLQLGWWLEAAELMIPGCLGWGAPWPLDLEEGPAIGRRIRHPSRHSWWTRRRMPHPHHRRRTSLPLSPPPGPATIRLEIG